MVSTTLSISSHPRVPEKKREENITHNIVLPMVGVTGFGSVCLLRTPDCLKKLHVCLALYVRFEIGDRGCEIGDVGH